MQLTRPNIKYKKSFLEALLEYQSEEVKIKHNRNRHYNNLDKDDLIKDFNTYISSELAKEKGLNIPAGYVAESVFWLIDQEEFIGKVNIRHQLTEKLKQAGGHIGYDIRPSLRNRGYGKNILRLALEEAKKIGKDQVLLTCNVNNLPSKKVIEENGGIFQDQLNDNLRYWIKLK